MCLGQIEDTEKLHIVQLYGCVILIDQQCILVYKGVPLYV